MRQLAVAFGTTILVAVVARIGGAPAWLQLACIAAGTGLGLLVFELRARNDPVAMVNRARLLQRLGKDARAEQWYRKAAGLNFSPAMVILGLLHEGRKKRATAQQWYREAAALNDPIAMVFLGRFARAPTWVDDRFSRSAATIAAGSWT